MKLFDVRKIAATFTHLIQDLCELWWNISNLIALWYHELPSTGNLTSVASAPDLASSEPRLNSGHFDKADNPPKLQAPNVSETNAPDFVRIS